MKTRTIHRILALRLIGVGVVIAVILGSMAWYSERELIGERIIDRAVLGTHHFNIMVQPLLDAEGKLDAAAMQQEMDRFTVAGIVHHLGDFMYVGVRTTDQRVLARFADSGYARIASVIRHVAAAAPGLPSTPEGIYTEVVKIEDYPHLLVSLPLHKSDGSVPAFIYGVFAPSADALGEIRRSLWMTVMWVMIIVLATTLLLYPVILRLLRRLADLSLDLMHANMETLQTLGSAIALRDNDTDAHNHRVTIFAVRLAEAIGLDRRLVRSLIKGALLHDVGKIGTPDRVLLKPGSLTDDEYAIMKQHVRHGVEIVSRSAWLADAEAVVRNHHEKVDGSGYDDGTPGGEIPVEARIFAIADVFDALTSRRPYKEPMSYGDAMAILHKGRGSHFDAELLDTFERIAPELFETFANQEGDSPRKALAAIVDRYFGREVGAILD